MENTGENMKDLSKALIIEAESNLETAEILLKSEKYADSISYSQQAAEKIIKALLTIEGRGTIIDHYISAIFAETVLMRTKDPKLLAKLRDTLYDLQYLEKFIPRVKYPRKLKNEIWIPSKGYKKKDAENALDKAKLIFTTIRELLKNKYKI